MLDLPLHFQHRPAAAGVSEPWLLVLMHGVGSNEADLFGLAPWIPPQFHVLSLRAPLALGPGAWAWFPFGVAPDGRRVIDAAQERRSRDTLTHTLELAAQQLGLPSSRVVAGGFSQGGIMALSLLLTQPQILQAALVLHGRLLPEALPQQAEPPALAGRSLWLSHGLQDEVLPSSFTAAIGEHVRALPLSLQMAGFPGGHTIGEAELRALVDWLQRLSAPA